MKRLFIPALLAFNLVIGFSSCEKASPDITPEKKVPEEGASYRDTLFTPPDGPVWHAAILPDSQLIVAGNLYNTGLQNTVVLARLSKNGVLDTTFNAHKDKWNYSEVNTLSLLNGGKILLYCQSPASFFGVQRWYFDR